MSRAFENRDPQLQICAYVEWDQLISRACCNSVLAAGPHTLGRYELTGPPSAYSYVNAKCPASAVPLEDTVSNGRLVEKIFNALASHERQ